jgi:hypothetical protein
VTTESVSAGYPARLEVDYPERHHRLTTLFRIVLVIPIAILILIVLSVAAFFAVIIARFTILFAGRYPRGLFNFVVGVR